MRASSVSGQDCPVPRHSQQAAYFLVLQPSASEDRNRQNACLHYPFHRKSLASQSSTKVWTSFCFGAVCKLDRSLRTLPAQSLKLCWLSGSRPEISLFRSRTPLEHSSVRQITVYSTSLAARACRPRRLDSTGSDAISSWERLDVSCLSQDAILRGDMPDSSHVARSPRPSGERKPQSEAVKPPRARPRRSRSSPRARLPPRGWQDHRLPAESQGCTPTDAPLLRHCAERSPPGKQCLVPSSMIRLLRSSLETAHIHCPASGFLSRLHHWRRRREHARARPSTLACRPSQRQFCDDARRHPFRNRSARREDEDHVLLSHREGDRIGCRFVSRTRPGNRSLGDPLEEEPVEEERRRRGFQGRQEWYSLLLGCDVGASFFLPLASHADTPYLPAHAAWTSQA